MKHKATIIFYDTALDSEAGSKRLTRLQRMIHREHLSVSAEHFERMPGTLDDLLGTPQASQSPAEPRPLLPEVRYSVVAEAQDPKKLYALVSLLRAFAEYCGIHSRLYQWAAE